jgi:hypothetical protein
MLAGILPEPQEPAPQNDTAYDPKLKNAIAEGVTTI